MSHTARKRAIRALMAERGVSHAEAARQLDAQRSAQQALDSNVALASRAFEIEGDPNRQWARTFAALFTAFGLTGTDGSVPRLVGAVPRPGDPDTTMFRFLGAPGLAVVAVRERQPYLSTLLTGRPDAITVLDVPGDPTRFEIHSAHVGTAPRQPGRNGGYWFDAALADADRLPFGVSATVDEADTEDSVAVPEVISNDISNSLMFWDASAVPHLGILGARDSGKTTVAQALSYGAIVAGWKLAVVAPLRAQDNFSFVRPHAMAIVEAEWPQLTENFTGEMRQVVLRTDQMLDQIRTIIERRADKLIGVHPSRHREMLADSPRVLVVIEDCTALLEHEATRAVPDDDENADEFWAEQWLIGVINSLRDKIRTTLDDILTFGERFRVHLVCVEQNTTATAEQITPTAKTAKLLLDPGPRREWCRGFWLTGDGRHHHSGVEVRVWASSGAAYAAELTRRTGTETTNPPPEWSYWSDSDAAWREHGLT